MTTLTLKIAAQQKRLSLLKDKTTIINGGGEGDAIEERVKQIKLQIDDAKSDYDREKLQERLGKLSGGVAVLYVGAATEAEMKEKKDRVDDALSATRAAIEEGIVVGGGVAFIKAGKVLDDLQVESEYQIGVDIVKRALSAPCKQIAINAGVSSDVVVNTIVASDNKNFGYNARTDKYEDLIAAGVIDPKKVSRVALENASSAAGMILLTECAMIDIPEKNPSALQGMPMM